MPTETIILPTAEALADSAATAIASLLRDAVVRHEHASVCLTGGSTPKATYQRLAGSASNEVDWTRTHFWFGDERCVPLDHEQSNYHLANSALLSRIAVPADNVHRIKGESGATDGAEAYDAELRNAFRDAATEQTFDVLLLGVGADGHIASLFPASSSLGEPQRWAIGAAAPDTMPIKERVSVTLPVFNRACHVIFLVEGKGKREILTRILMHNEQLPAALVHGIDSTTWMMDEAAAPSGM